MSEQRSASLIGCFCGLIAIWRVLGKREEEMMSSKYAEKDVDSIVAMSINGYPYKRVDGEWQPNEEARREQLANEASEQKRKDELLFACGSRVLTDAEIDEVEKLGIGILVRMNGGMSEPYLQEELERRLRDLLLQQIRLRSTTKAEGR